MKRKKNISEMTGIVVTLEPNTNIVVDNMLAEWSDAPFAQLSVAMVHLKYLYSLHQNHHWVSCGDPFYGDHLLFQKIYEGIAEEIDSLAEKAVGLGCTENVNLELQTSQLLKLVKGGASAMMMPTKSDLAKKSLIAEMNFLSVMKQLCESLRECGLMTHGLDNLLAGIEDKHEGHVYLLKQRCANDMYL